MQHPLDTPAVDGSASKNNLSADLVRLEQDGPALIGEEDRLVGRSAEDMDLERLLAEVLAKAWIPFHGNDAALSCEHGDTPKWMPYIQV